MQTGIRTPFAPGTSHILRAAALVGVLSVTVVGCKKRNYNNDGRTKSDADTAAAPQTSGAKCESNGITCNDTVLGMERGTERMPKPVPAGVIWNESLPHAPKDAGAQKMVAVVDEYTSITPCDLTYLAGAWGMSWQEAKVRAGTKLAAKDRAWIQDLLDYANGGGLIDKVPWEAGGALLSKEAVNECTEYLYSMRQTRAGCAQFLLADYHTAQKDWSASSPFYKQSSKGLVSFRTFKATVGNAIWNGKVKEMQDDILAAVTYFEKNKPDWKGGEDANDLTCELGDAKGVATALKAYEKMACGVRTDRVKSLHADASESSEVSATLPDSVSARIQFERGESKNGWAKGVATINDAGKSSTVEGWLPLEALRCRPNFGD